MTEEQIKKTKENIGKTLTDGQLLKTETANFFRALDENGFEEVAVATTDLHSSISSFYQKEIDGRIYMVQYRDAVNRRYVRFGWQMGFNDSMWYNLFDVMFMDGILLKFKI